MKLKNILVTLTVSLIVSGCTKPATIYTHWPFDSKEAARRQDDTAKALGVPKELTLDLGNGVKMKLVLIPAGKFVMGSPKDEKGWSDDEIQHEVRITKPFYMGIYTVTQEHYQQVMGKNPSRFNKETNPVEMVSWYDAVEFCKVMSPKTGNNVSLPTEAQWEWACRSGTTTPFNTGETISTDEANYKPNSVYENGDKGEFRKKTMPVGTFKPNAWGLYDMHGNVWQWCADWYDDKYYGDSTKNNPKGPTNGEARVLRGGCWDVRSVVCRSAFRGGDVPGDHRNFIGFRVIVEIK